MIHEMLLAVLSILSRSYRPKQIVSEEDMDRDLESVDQACAGCAAWGGGLRFGPSAFGVVSEPATDCPRPASQRSGETRERPFKMTNAYRPFIADRHSASKIQKWAGAII